MAAFDNLSNPSEYLAYWGKTYRNELLSNILPFWMKYGLDKENGGYFTCVDRDGTLMDSTKSVWFQGRFAFNISTRVSAILPRSPLSRIRSIHPINYGRRY